MQVASKSLFIMKFLPENYLNTFIYICQQDSPPAWTQEAYRPPRSEYFCCSNRGGGDTPSLLGVPQLGYPHLDLAGVPHLGYPPSGPAWGTPPSWTLLGYPHPDQARVSTHPDLAGVPHQLDLAEVPPIWTWPGYPPCGQTDGWMDGQTDTCQNITFPSYYERRR